MEKPDLKSLTLNELRDLFNNIGEKSFRGDQVFNWIHHKLIESFSDIKVISGELKDKLDENYSITNLEIVKRLDSKDDSTKKYLLMLEDGNIIESVLMKYKHGNSICLSTQVGCKMGCSFCASTKEGVVRSLSAGEILDQCYTIIKDLNITINNIVLMGSGEPLDNYENVIKFLKIIHDAKGQNLSYRNITLSTCGIVPRIYDLANEQIPITLSISLHSPFDKEREKIMPIAKKYKTIDIIKACEYYINSTNRRITFEYTLIDGHNDRAVDAEELIGLLKGLLCHINLIPLNPIKESTLDRSHIDSINKFKNFLEKKGLSVTVRQEKGTDVNAACGQLRRDYIDNK